jgi:anti-anti-sigma factor
MLMTTTKTEQPRGFRVAGEVDMSNQGALSRMLAREAAADGDLTLDLSELRFIDSSGVQALLRTARDLAGHGGRLLLVGTRPSIRKTFDLMGVGRAPGVVLEAGAPTCAHPARPGRRHPPGGRGAVRLRLPLPVRGRRPRPVLGGGGAVRLGLHRPLV